MKVNIEYDGKKVTGHAYPTHRGANPFCAVVEDGIYGLDTGAPLEWLDALERGETVKTPDGWLTVAPAV